MTATNENNAWEAKAEAMYRLAEQWKQEAEQLRNWANLAWTVGRRWYEMEAGAELCERHAAELERALKEGEA